MLLLKGEKSNCCKADIAYKGYNTFTFETTSFCSKCMKECTTYFEKDEADEAREEE